MVLWLLRAGRDVSISDVDVAWIAPPYALLRSVPDADVLSGSDCFGVPCDTDPRVHQQLWHFHWRIGTDCLNVPYDADRSPRKSNVRNCGHQSGSTWSAWFNTGVMFFRARPAAVDMMAEWRDTMAEIKGEAQARRRLSASALAFHSTLLLIPHSFPPGAHTHTQTHTHTHTHTHTLTHSLTH